MKDGPVWEQQRGRYWDCGLNFIEGDQRVDQGLRVKRVGHLFSINHADDGPLSKLALFLQANRSTS
mgnify:CR=1 FL=1